jgi:hypothetical protein
VVATGVVELKAALVVVVAAVFPVTCDASQRTTVAPCSDPESISTAAQEKDFFIFIKTNRGVRGWSCYSGPRIVTLMKPLGPGMTMLVITSPKKDHCVPSGSVLYWT